MWRGLWGPAPAAGAAARRGDAGSAPASAANRDSLGTGGAAAMIAAPTAAPRSAAALEAAAICMPLARRCGSLEKSSGERRPMVSNRRKLDMRSAASPSVPDCALSMSIRLSRSEEASSDMRTVSCVGRVWRLVRKNALEAARLKAVDMRVRMPPCTLRAVRAASRSYLCSNVSSVTAMNSDRKMYLQQRGASGERMVNNEAMRNWAYTPANSAAICCTGHGRQDKTWRHR